MVFIVIAQPIRTIHIIGICINDKHRQPDVVCLIDGANLATFLGCVLILYNDCITIFLKKHHSLNKSLCLSFSSSKMRVCESHVTAQDLDVDR